MGGWTTTELDGCLKAKKYMAAPIRTMNTTPPATPPVIAATGTAEEEPPPEELPPPSMSTIGVGTPALGVLAGGAPSH
eukprot:CAMPEP_0184371644 /NCGR_PEP_ID=MMETSP1089-20130417/163514_1 /TAXON_ID=38269 ORGANISM="Gloeochaete wittrockiana, Strain SAG46.84" /NCGR_SAMPLE_ID=MMETSP1089 /ASSEMBLY_ACC=CAM_ASM_000445 /LENGTH=77 /DNA_ID=CAMNT_0026714425 /DNA_START=834 /DNA_END=1067 /DNA_ORIENTATION=+